MLLDDMQIVRINRNVQACAACLDSDDLPSTTQFYLRVLLLPALLRSITSTLQGEATGCLNYDQTEDLYHSFYNLRIELALPDHRPRSSVGWKFVLWLQKKRVAKQIEKLDDLLETLSLGRDPEQESFLKRYLR